MLERQCTRPEDTLSFNVVLENGTTSYSGIGSPKLDICIGDWLASAGVDDIDIQVHFDANFSVEKV